jgi:hypothetical protein
MKEGTDSMSRSLQIQFPRGTSRQAARRASSWIAAFVFALLAGAAPRAQAQDPATIDKLVQLNKKAMDDFDTADFDAAKKTLLDAEKMGKKAGLEGHPVMARTYIHLGAVYLAGYKDKQKSQHYFGKALDIQPDIRLDKNMTSASLKDAFAAAVAAHGSPVTEAAPSSSSGGRKGRAHAEPEAQETAVTESETESGGAGKKRRGSSKDEAGGGGGEPDLPKKIVALDCPYPNDIGPGKKLTLRCAAAANLGIAGVTLYYKGFQMDDYDTIAMEQSPKGWWQAQVPKKSVDGKSLQFYFEGLDASDKPVVSNGRAESPNVMLIVNKSLPKVKKRREEEDPLAVDIDIADRKFGNRRFWIGLGLGTGVAVPFGGKPEALVNNVNDQGHSPAVPSFPPGWAGIAHLAPVIGYQFNPNWGISIEGRDQYILRPKGVSSTVSASGAHAVLLKVLHYTKQGRTRGFFGLGGGGGEGIREIVNVPRPGQSTFQDTILIGPVLVNGAAGVIYEITSGVSWIAQLNLYLGFPKWGVVADLNTGVQMNFGDSSGRAEAAAKLRKESVSGSVEDEDEPRN